MTPDQLKQLDAALEQRGYSKFKTCLLGKEDYAWFKSFGLHKDEYGDTEADYQISFQIFDWRGKEINPPEQSMIWLTVSMIPCNLPDSIQCDYSLQLDVPEIDLAERMMADFYETAKRHLTQKDNKQ